MNVSFKNVTLEIKFLKGFVLLFLLFVCLSRWLLSHCSFPAFSFSFIPFSDLIPPSLISLLALNLSQSLLTALNVSQGSLSWTLFDSMYHYSCSIADRNPQQSTSYLLFPSISQFYLLACHHFWPHHRFCVCAEAVHHVSISINVSHSLLICHEAWGTDPSFIWLHERAAITQQVGKVSKDGNMLIVTTTPICGHFTCMVSNKLGYSSATYTAGMRIYDVLLWPFQIFRCSLDQWTY